MTHRGAHDLTKAETAELQALRVWFKENRKNLPITQFRLYKYDNIVDTKLFYEAITEELDSSECPRNASLLDEVRALKEHVETIPQEEPWEP